MSYVNPEIGGGTPQLVADSLGDTFRLASSTGFALNHTEDLYLGVTLAASPQLTVGVSFRGGATAQGGSVAVVVVENATLRSIVAIAPDVGNASPASVTLAGPGAGGLLLLGVAGREMSGPYTAGPGDILLDTGRATAGPFEDGIAYATLASRSSAPSVTLSADLDTSTYWEAIGVALSNGAVPLGPPTVVGHSGVVNNYTTVRTPPIGARAGGLVLAFVSYVNSEIGGGAPVSIEDSLGDTYFLLATTGYDINHTESLYVTSPSSATSNLIVSVSFGGGVTPQGGSVAVVDVANVSTASIESVVVNTGAAGPANVTLVTNQSGDLFLLGTAGRQVSGPYTAGPFEQLLDTGAADAGPFQDGVAYGTFERVSGPSTVTLSANLNYPTYWEAIGLALAANAG